jgi:hypothetical protein
MKSSDDIKCKKCGSVFRMSYMKICMRDKDSIDCEVCGNEDIYRWNEAKIWSANLIKRKEEHK